MHEHAKQNQILIPSYHRHLLLCFFFEDIISQHDASSSFRYYQFASALELCVQNQIKTKINSLFGILSYISVIYK